VKLGLLVLDEFWTTSEILNELQRSWQLEVQFSSCCKQALSRLKMRYGYERPAWEKGWERVPTRINLPSGVGDANANCRTKILVSIFISKFQAVADCIRMQ